MQLQPLRVLIIDDNEAQGDGLAELLRIKEFDATWAATGQAGLDYAAKHALDAVLLDMALPDISGPEVCRKLREDPRMAQTAIIYHTGSQPAQGEKYGGDAFLTFPVSFEELFAVIRGTVLRRRTRSRAEDSADPHS
jgi:DNA-binding response OmpR family regulator